MNTASRLKKEIIVLIGGVGLLYVAAMLCGIRKTLFASSASAFGGVILLLACRSLIASIFSKRAAVDEQKA
jgi:hypothetical protein